MSDERNDVITITLPALELPAVGHSSPEGEIRVPGLSFPEKRIVIQPSRIVDLSRLAREVAQRAHAPYSRFHVGASLVMADDSEGMLFSGSNVENASYGATMCAERSAIFSASAKGFRRIGVLVVSTIDSLEGPTEARSPCGMCRQVIREFADENTVVVIDSGEDGVLGEIVDIDRLLPWGFSLTPQTGSEGGAG